MSNTLATTVTAYIGLGSNLDDPADQIKRALNELQQLPSSRLISHSSLYRSEPVGPQDQPDFINAVAALETQLSAERLLDELQTIEHAHRRVRQQHWGPRTLDLDILLYGDSRISNDRLTVPHVEMLNRSFVLYPLAEIAPALKMPDASTLESHLCHCPMGRLQRLAL